MRKLGSWLLVRYDSNGDEEIDYSEAEDIVDIEVNTDNITSLTGIESFPNLHHLHAAGSTIGKAPKGKIGSIDISQNHYLEELYLINIDDNNYNRRHQGINRTVPSKLYIRQVAWS